MGSRGVYFGSAPGACVALAARAPGWYPHLMLARCFARLSTMLLAASLVIGPAHGSMRAAWMISKPVPVAALAVHVPDDSSDCMRAGVAASVCSVWCTGMVAVSVDTPMIDGGHPETSRGDTSGILPGRDISPDPYPPRLAVLS